MTKSEYWRKENDKERLDVSDIAFILDDLEEAETPREPKWGHCRRGCEPSYLDTKGFCSPACHLGAPRGEYVTEPKCSASNSATISQKG